MAREKYFVCNGVERENRVPCEQQVSLRRRQGFEEISASDYGCWLLLPFKLFRQSVLIGYKVWTLDCDVMRNWFKF